MLKAVLDTNVLVSATIHPKGPSRKIIEAWQKKDFILVVSPAIIAEVVRALRYPRIARKYKITDSDIRVVLGQLLTRSQLAFGALPTPSVIKTDEADNYVLGCAEESEANYIVSGDAHLLAVKEYKEILIVPPRIFLEILSS